MRVTSIMAREGSSLRVFNAAPQLAKMLASDMATALVIADGARPLEEESERMEASARTNMDEGEVGMSGSCMSSTVLVMYRVGDVKQDGQDDEVVVALLLRIGHEEDRGMYDVGYRNCHPDQLSAGESVGYEVGEPREGNPKP